VNKELETLILAYEKVSASKDKEAERHLFTFESMIDNVMERHPHLSRRKSAQEHH
jgi:hypothetical protein